MFHLGGPRFRTWLDAYASSSPRSPARLVEEVQRLTGILGQLERDHAERLAAVERLTSQLDESERDRAERLRAIERLHVELEASEADRAARLEVIRHLQQLTSDLEAQSTDLRGELTRHQHELATCQSEADRRGRELAALENERGAWLQPLPGLRLRVPGGRVRADRWRRGWLRVFRRGRGRGAD